MNQNRPGRRRALTGALAFASLGIVPGGAGASSASIGREEGEYEYLDFAAMEAEADREAALLHGPFRAEFLAWLRDAAARFAKPVRAEADTPFTTRLHVPGLQPALDIVLSGDTDINVWVMWEGRCWDILASMDVYPSMLRDGSGWVNGGFIPEAQRPHPTREACWRQDGFESLLDWFNAELLPATHLALIGGSGCDDVTGWTAAHLVKDGLVARTGRPVETDSPFLWHLVPLHAALA